MNKLFHRLVLIRKSPYLTSCLRLVLGTVFLYAASEKIARPEDFAVAIQNYQLIPLSLTNLSAMILPWLELYCGLLLLLGLWHQPAAFLTTVMNVVFLIALLSAYYRGLDIECGCFGSGSEVNLGRILEDLLLLAFSLHILFYPASFFALENRLPGKEL